MDMTLANLAAFLPLEDTNRLFTMCTHHRTCKAWHEGTSAFPSSHLHLPRMRRRGSHASVEDMISFGVTSRSLASIHGITPELALISDRRFSEVLSVGRPSRGRRCISCCIFESGALHHILFVRARQKCNKQIQTVLCC